MAVLHGRDAAAVRERRDPSAFLAHALTGLLISNVAIAAARLVVPLASRSDTPFQLEIDLKPVVVLWRLAFLATVVVFLVWFYEARVSAEGSGWPQRRARGWVFWGWVIPIASLWVPLQIMRDIWRASLPPSSRSKAAWLPSVWWISWLLEGCGCAFAAGAPGGQGLRWQTRPLGLDSLGPGGAASSQRSWTGSQRAS